MGFQGAIVRNALILFFTLASISFSSFASINTSKLNPSNLQTASVSNYVIDLSSGKHFTEKFQCRDANCFTDKANDRNGDIRCQTSA